MTTVSATPDFAEKSKAMRAVVLRLTTNTFLRMLPARERRRIPETATFAIVALDRTSGKIKPTVVATDSDVNGDQTPDEAARRHADEIGAVYLGHDRTMLYAPNGDGWQAWDSALCMPHHMRKCRICGREDDHTVTGRGTTRTMVFRFPTPPASGSTR